MREIKFNRTPPSLYGLCIAGLLVTVAGNNPLHAAPAANQQLQQNAEGVIIAVPQGWLRLQVCTPTIIRVSYSTTQTFAEQKVPTVIGKFTPVKFKVAADVQTIKVSTTQVQVEVNRTNGAVRFLDLKGNPILSETDGGRSLTPTTLPGMTATKSLISKQDFVLEADEDIYGLGQHQDRSGSAGNFPNLSYRGTVVPLQQDYITNMAIPFLVSSNGYGLLWNNAAPTTVAVGIGPETPIPAAQLYSEDGKPGGLTGQYFSGTSFDTPVATRIDPQIDFNWTNTPPEGLPREGYSVRWTGSIEAKDDDDYTIIASTDDGVRMWIDDKLVVDDWNPRAVKSNDVTLHFAANSRHKIRLEYYQDKFDAVAKLTWRIKPKKSTVAWKSEASDGIDYYFFYGPSIDNVIAGYRQTTGQVPMPPKWSLGFWQSKERYTSQKELLDIAAEYRTRRMPIDNIVQDWQYWDPKPWGSHYLDPKRYPDLKAATDELHQKYNMQLMISVWPRFNPGTAENPNANYDVLKAKGYLLPRQEGGDLFYDAFNPAARQLYWQQMRDQLFGKGIDAWWLDAAEPEVDLNNLRSAQTGLGPAINVMNAYPLMHSTAVHDGQLAAAPDKRVSILTRSAYAGQQRNGMTVWSSDIAGTWAAFAHQVPTGLNMGLSSIPYWASDTGGFFVAYPGGNENPEYRELFTRWFQWSAFNPIFRVHGTNTARELWRFGPTYEPILVKYDNLRYRLMPYIYSQAWQISSQSGTMMRPLVMDFPQDVKARQLPDQFLFGPAILVNPVTTQGATSRSVYLPKGTGWTDFWTGAKTTGGQTVNAAAPIDTMPLYVRDGSIISMGPTIQYTSEKPADPIELRVYPGADGTFTLYEDEGVNNNYKSGRYATIPISWSDSKRTLTIDARKGSFVGMLQNRTFNLVLVKPSVGVGLDAATTSTVIKYNGKRTSVVVPE